MPKIPRKTQKVFSGAANGDQIAVFGSMKTGTPVYSSDIETLQSNEYELGWSDAILNDKAPYLEEMNGVQYGLSAQIAYILQQGLALEWDSNTNYYKGSTVAVINDTTVSYYKSITNDNQGNNPTSDGGTNWVLDSISKIETYNTNLTNAINTLNSQVVKLTGNQTIAGTKTFSASPKVPNSTTTGTALALQSRGGNNIKLGDGTLFIWGGSTLVSGHYFTVNLPTSFQNGSSYTAIVCDAGETTSIGSYKIYTQSSSSFRVYLKETANNDYFHWFAIGR